MSEVNLPRAARAPLRVALLLDDYTQPKWVYNIVRDIVDSDVARVAVVVVNARAGDADAADDGGLLDRVSRWVGGSGLLPLSLYTRVDRWRFGALLPDPFEQVDVTPLVADAPVVRVAPGGAEHDESFPDEALAEIAGFDVDVALRFGFRSLRGRALQIARYGVWSYHHGVNPIERTALPGTWEVFAGQPATGAVLRVLSDDTAGAQVLCQTFSSTAGVSVVQNQANHFWQASPMVIRKLRDVYYDGESALRDRALEAEAETGHAAVAGDASPAAFWPLVGRLAGRYVREKVRQLRYDEQWCLSYHLAPHFAPGRAEPPTGCEGEAPVDTPGEFQLLPSPDDRFWADPFPVYDGDRYYVFFEELLYATNRGRISVVEINARGVAGAAVPVLERDYHLSYPFVFAHAGAWYMIPETGERDGVELFRATEFPRRWEFDRTLVELPAPTDATLAEIDGRWWMFLATRAPEVQEWAELSIFHAADPLGPWEPHPRNPVKADARSVRPAGRVFRRDGAYYRPAQDGTPRYGSAIVINRIDRIDLAGYAESTVSRIDPLWAPGLTGTHTLNAAAGLTTIDARRLRRR